MTASSLHPSAADPTTTAGRARQPWWRKPLLTVHIATATALIGADLALLSLGVLALRGADPQLVYPAASQVASWVIAPLVVAALATGVAQAVGLHWGLVRYWWLTIKLTLTLAFTGIVWFVLTPRLLASADAAAAGDTFTTGERLPLSLVPALAVAVQVLLVGLAVYKPGRRLRAGRRLPR